MYCVDLGESFHKSEEYLVFTIYLQKSASIQPRTSYALNDDLKSKLGMRITRKVTINTRSTFITIAD